MEFPKVTQWDENRLNIPEDMKVLQSFRGSKEPGKPLETLKQGDDIKQLKGELKKDLYFQLKVCYKSDYDALVRYLKSRLKTGAESGAMSRTQPAYAEIADLKKSIAEMKKTNETLVSKINVLEKKDKGGAN